MNYVRWVEKLVDDVQHGRAHFPRELIGPLQKQAAFEAQRKGIVPRPVPQSPAMAKAIPIHPDPPASSRTTERTYRELPWSSSEYFNFRDALASDIRQGLIGQTVGQIVERARACSGLDPAQSAEWAERFFNDLKRGLDRKQGRR
jgi:hypothetical protein